MFKYILTAMLFAYSHYGVASQSVSGVNPTTDNSVKKLETIAENPRLNTPKVVGRFEVFYFYAKWCPNCRETTPVFDRLKSENPDVASFKFDIDVDSRIASEIKVNAVPTACISLVEADTKEFKYRCYKGAGPAMIERMFEQVKEIQKK